MPHNKNTDRAVKRILPWVALLGISALVVFWYAPVWFGAASESESSRDESAYDTASGEDFPTSDTQFGESSPPETDQLDNEHITGSDPEGKPDQSGAKSGSPENQPLQGFVKAQRTFTNANNFWNAISNSDFNPALVEQLVDLKKRLAQSGLSSVDVLYSDYYDQGKPSAENSKILMVRGNASGKGWTFYAYERNGKIFFYDEYGDAPEPSMDRTPIQYTRISSPYNPNRRHPITGRIRAHEGVDLKQAYGTPVKTTGNGVVTFAGAQRGYGRLIIIHHANGYETRYAHLSAIGVKKGQQVKRGEVIGKLGNSGISTGAHVHYEVRINGVAQNPMKVKLPSYNPLPRDYMQTWQFRTAQYREEMGKLRQKSTI
ncbi:M23 family metallopeptidase [Suttonella sp. R2A3]|uniref:M23 family metallopeptidase n=1 Tax=Suttonella sp. R2A3 TaxID=2908648 RepID=UPI001F448C62|nr:M23 family metallopeptidase [Suttonella sp. R2A3]UJF24115.1 M23 family metallopeptidase [Suttonella sp. R2A3]